MSKFLFEEQTDDERVKAATEGVFNPASDQRADRLPLPAPHQHVQHLRPLQKLGGAGQGQPVVHCLF